MRWDAAVDGFLEDCAGRALSGLTLSAYRTDLRAFRCWWEGAHGPVPELSAVTPADVGAFRRAMEDAGLRPSTVNRRLAVLKTFWTWAVDAGGAEGNAARRVKRIPEAPAPPRAVATSAVAALLRSAAADGDLRDAALVAVMAYAGLRVAEAVALRWEDVRLSPDPALLVRRGKGGKWRTVPLSAPPADALAALRAAEGGVGPVFPSRHPRRAGRPILTRSVWNVLRRRARAAGISAPVSPHMLRHRFCKSLVDAGVSLDRVAALAGHANLTTTARYTRPTEEDLRAAVAHLVPALAAKSTAPPARGGAHRKARARNPVTGAP